MSGEENSMQNAKEATQMHGAYLGVSECTRVASKVL